MIGTVSIVIVAAVATLIGLVNFLDNDPSRHVNDEGIILITGASKGIGRHAAEHIARTYPNYLVLAGVRKESDFINITDTGIKNLVPLILDVSSHSSCVQAVESIRSIVDTEKLPFISLVNNAGVAKWKVTEDLDVTEARSIFDSNFFGAYDLTQMAIPLLRESQGRIIMVSSIAGFAPIPLTGAYSASKFAMEAFSDVLRMELSHMNISVSVIQPGFIKTGMLQDINSTIHSTRDSPIMRALYANILSDNKMISLERDMLSGGDPSVTTEAIVHAITSTTPKTRYTVGPAGRDLPASLLSWIMWILPDRVVDTMILNI